MIVPSTFRERAEIVVRYGVPVFPLLPRMKDPFLLSWQDRATTDLKQIEQWDAENDDYNSGSVAKFGGCWMLDIDNPDVYEQVRKDTGHDLNEIDTLIVCSSGLKRHFYFQHDSRSEQIGNQSLKDATGERLSIRANNRYCVGPGSQHPNGGVYTVVNEPAFSLSLACGPAWLFDWIEKQVENQSAKTSPNRNVQGRILKGWRHDTLLSRAGRFLRAGATKEETASIIRRMNEQDCEEPYVGQELEDEIHRVVFTSKILPAADGLVIVNGHISGSQEDPQTASDSTFSAPISVSIKYTMADTIEPEPVDFLWKPYLQRNALCAYYGDPGVGKGNVSIDHIACLTTGRAFPGEEAGREPMYVAVMVGEENIKNTIVPRLMAAGADRSKVQVLQTVRFHSEKDKMDERLITFQNDMAALREHFKAHPEVKFLLVDPVTNYSGNIKFNQDDQVRPILMALAQLAEDMTITVLIIGHFNKNSAPGSALDKPGGARAWVAVPRCVFGFFKNPEDSNIRVMASLKTNNARESDTSLTFTIGEQTIEHKSETWTAPNVKWGTKTEQTAQELLMAANPELRREHKGKDFLEEFLADGPRVASEAYAEGEKKNICERTLKRASNDLRILKFQTVKGWIWQLSSDPTPIPYAASSLNPWALAKRKKDFEVESKEAQPSNLTGIGKGV